MWFMLCSAHLKRVQSEMPDNLFQKIRQCLYEHLMNHWNVRRSFIRFINIVKEKAYILFVLVTCMQVTTIGDFIKNLAYLK